MMDLFTTALQLAETPLPSEVPIDGIDLRPLLLEKKSLPSRPFFYYRGDKLAACRIGDWKAHFFTQTGYGEATPITHDSPVLHHLGLDPSEKRDIAAEHPEIIEKIRAAVTEHQKTLMPGEPQLQ
jgi:arylsulfatase A-like enzyme